MCSAACRRSRRRSPTIRSSGSSSATRFGRPSERIQSSLGSGVIVSPDGVVVTNTHVIKGRGETEIRIALSDKREFDAKVVTQDDKTDIAMLEDRERRRAFPDHRPSRTPTRSRWATWCSPSAIRSASGRR